MQDLDAGDVLEVDVVEGDLAADVGELHGIGGVHDLGPGVQHLEDALTAGHGPLELRVLEDEVSDGVEEALDVEGEGDDNADAEGAVHDAQATEDDDQGGGDGHQQLHQGHHRGGEAAGLHVCAPVIGVHLVEAADVLFLPRQALDDADAGDVLLKVGVDHGYGLAGADEGAAGAGLPEGHAHYEDGHDGEGDEGQLDVQVEEEEDDEPQAGEVGEDGEEAGGEEFLEDVDVVLDTGHDAARLVAVQKAEGELLDVIEHLGAEGEEDIVAYEGGGHLLERLAGPGQEGEAEEGAADGVEAGQVGGGQELIDGEADEERLAVGGGGKDQHAQDGHGHPPAVGLEVGQQAHHDGMVVQPAQLLVVPAVGASFEGAARTLPGGIVGVAPAAGGASAPESHRYAPPAVAGRRSPAGPGSASSCSRSSPPPSP